MEPESVSVAGAQRVDPEDAQRRLEELEKKILSLSAKVTCSLVRRVGADPVLRLEAGEISEDDSSFLLDQPSAGASCYVDSGTGGLVARAYTYNREPISLGSEDKQLFLDQDDIGLKGLLEALNGDRFAACRGFVEDEAAFVEVFSRARKADMRSLLMDRYGGVVRYRARGCKFVVDLLKEAEGIATCELFSQKTHCSECRAVLAELDAKYCGGRLCGTSKHTENSPPQQEPAVQDTQTNKVQESEKTEDPKISSSRKRKTRACKRFFGEDFVVPNEERKKEHPEDDTDLKVRR